MIAERFEKLPAAAEGCDALVATGLFPVVASAHSMADNQVLNDLDIRNYNGLFGGARNTRASLDLPAVDNVRCYVITDHPWLAAGPVLAPPPEPADHDVAQTGAWILPDDVADRPTRQRKGNEMRTCPTRGSTELETPVMRPAIAMQRSTAASEVSQ